MVGKTLWVLVKFKVGNDDNQYASLQGNCIEWNLCLVMEEGVVEGSLESNQTSLQSATDAFGSLLD